MVYGLRIHGMMVSRGTNVGKLAHKFRCVDTRSGESCSRGQHLIVKLSGDRGNALGMVAAHRRHHPRCCRCRKVHICTCTPARVFRMASAPGSLTCPVSRKEELDNPSNLESQREQAWDHASVRYK